MSHTATVQTDVKDPIAVAAACRRLRIKAPVQGKHELHSSEHEGLAVKLDGWLLPVVIDTKTAQLHFDDYGGAWGDIAKLNQFKQAYAIEAAKRVAKKKGWQVREIKMADGSVKLACKA